MSGCLVFLVLFVIAPLILPHAIERIIFGDAQNQVQPENVDGLQHSQKAKCDDLTQQAFILATLPVEFKGSHGAEGGEDRPKDFQIEEVSQVNPNPDKEAEVGADEDRVEIV